MMHTQMYKVGFGVALLLGAFSGCSSAPAGNQALGIAEFQVSETATELSIRGLDANQQQVTALMLTVGHVSIPDDGLDGQGRTMAIDVNGRRAEHQSVGMDPLTLPAITGAAGAGISDFMRDSHVAPVLARWGVSLAAPGTPTNTAESGELAYNYCGHAFNPSCGETDCNDNPDDSYETVCCNSLKQVVLRACNTSCFSGCNLTTPPTMTVCGGAGSAGCTNCWMVDDYVSTCEIGNWNASVGASDYYVDTEGCWEHDWWNCDTKCANCQGDYVDSSCVCHCEECG